MNAQTPALNTQHIHTLVDKVEGWLTNREVDFLYRTARSCSQRHGVIVEIGSWKGKSTVRLAAASQASGQAPVFAIDPHEGSIEQNVWHEGKSTVDVFQANIALAGVNDLVRPIVKRSADAAKEWDQPISFLWIDGDHSYEGAKADFDLFSRWVIDGGVIAFHDSNQGEVPRAVREAFGSPEFVGVGCVDSIAYATKATGRAKNARDYAALWYIANAPRLRQLPLSDLGKSVLKRFKSILSV